MVEKLLVGIIVIVAIYFLIRILLTKIAGKASISPCDYCKGCSLSNKDKELCEQNNGSETT